MNTVEETLHDVTQKEYEVQNGDMESSNKTALDGILDNLPPILVGVAG